MFNLIVLILVTIVFLMFGYLITHVDIFSPFCVFCEMFLIAEFLCLFFSRMYKVEIHLNTILVIALGMISFGIVSAFFYMKRVDVRNYGEQHYFYKLFDSTSISYFGSSSSVLSC